MPRFINQLIQLTGFFLEFKARSLLHADPGLACSGGLAMMRELTDGCGGAVLVTSDGLAVADFTTEKMP